MQRILIFEGKFNLPHILILVYVYNFLRGIWICNQNLKIPILKFYPPIGGTPQKGMDGRNMASHSGFMNSQETQIRTVVHEMPHRKG